MRALEPSQRQAHGFHQAISFSVIFFNQVDDGFRIRFGMEYSALCRQFIPQSQVIFNDAVMHHHHFPVPPICGWALRAFGSP